MGTNEREEGLKAKVVQTFLSVIMTLKHFPAIHRLGERIFKSVTFG